MSMPADEIYCDRCDFQASTLKVWGSYEYLLPDGGRVPMSYRLGWCHSCGDLVVIEDLSVADQLTADMKKATDRLVPLIEPGLRNTLKRLRPLTRREINDLKLELHATESVLQLLRDRTSPARCLTCAGTDISPC